MEVPPSSLNGMPNAPRQKSADEESAVPMGPKPATNAMSMRQANAGIARIRNP